MRKVCLIEFSCCVVFRHCYLLYIISFICVSCPSPFPSLRNNYMTFGSYPTVAPFFSSCINTASYRAYALSQWTYVPVRRIVYWNLFHKTVSIIYRKHAIVAEGKIKIIIIIIIIIYFSPCTNNFALATCMSIRFAWLCVCGSACQYVHWCICLPAPLSVGLPIPPTFLPALPCSDIPACLSARYSACVTSCLPACLLCHLSFSLSTHLPVCWPAWMAAGW